MECAVLLFVELCLKAPDAPGMISSRDVTGPCRSNPASTLAELQIARRDAMLRGLSEDLGLGIDSECRRSVGRNEVARSLRLLRDY